MFSRREPTRTKTTGAVIEPDIGFLRRRRLALQQLGVKPVGPQTFAGPEPALGVIEQGMMSSIPHIDEHHETIRAELAAIDLRRETIAHMLAAGAADAGSHKHQELRIEREQLSMLRRELERDLGSYPLARTDAHREYVASRARSLREQLWSNAERLAASGEHLHARKRRVDSLRARHLAEHEIGLRPGLSGY